jgi:hypothetical protein
MAERHAEKRAESPELAAVPVASFQKARGQIDAHIPDNVVREVVKRGMERRIDPINQQAKALAALPPCVQKALENEDIAKAFVQNPTRVGIALREIAHTARGAGPADTEKIFALVSGRQPPGEKEVFDAAELSKFAAMFARYSEVFVAIARDAKKDSYPAIRSFVGSDPEMFLREGLQLHGGAIKELGMPLDYLHEHKPERMQYLNSLQLFEVVSLLASDPSLYYTSSNHLLFDRLSLDFDTKGIVELKKQFGLSDELTRNLLLRAINYNRLGNMLSKENHTGDINLAVSIIVGTPESRTGIYSNRFDAQDLYFVSNGMGELMKYSPGVVDKVSARIKELEAVENPTAAQKKMALGLGYLTFLATHDAKGDKDMQDVAARSVFNPADYRTGGKTNVVQVFDKEDAHEDADHWQLTNDWLKKEYGEPKQGSRGELVYENAGTRITLFMGESKEANARYIKGWIKKNDAGIVTFRGHSYSLEANMPYETFGNKAGRYLFIPGSCGSAGSTPQYLDANPSTQLAFFSNTATGRGAVTNTLLDLVIEQKKPIEYPEILKKGEKRIAAHEGNVGEIKVFSPGEQILAYVNMQELKGRVASR